jgi:hypothetical protein
MAKPERHVGCPVRRPGLTWNLSTQLFPRTTKENDMNKLFIARSAAAILISATAALAMAQGTSNSGTGNSGGTGPQGSTSEPMTGTTGSKMRPGVGAFGAASGPMGSASDTKGQGGKVGDAAAKNKKPRPGAKASSMP